MNKLKDILKLVIASIISSDIFRLALISIAYICVSMICQFLAKGVSLLLGIDYHFYHGVFLFLIFIYVDMRTK